MKGKSTKREQKSGRPGANSHCILNKQQSIKLLPTHFLPLTPSVCLSFPIIPVDSGHTWHGEYDSLIDIRSSMKLLRKACSPCSNTLPSPPQPLHLSFSALPHSILLKALLQILYSELLNEQPKNPEKKTIHTLTHTRVH